MTPEREVELFTKLDVLMTMMRDQAATLAVIQTEQRRQAETLGELKGRIAEMPTARDFGHLEGRLEEISRRLPTTIGYTPPKSAAG